MELQTIINSMGNVSVILTKTRKMKFLYFPINFLLVSGLTFESLSELLSEPPSAKLPSR